MCVYSFHCMYNCYLGVCVIVCYLQMKDAIEKELKAANLQNIEITVTKIIQLYETKNSRCVMYMYMCIGAIEIL